MFRATIYFLMAAAFANLSPAAAKDWMCFEQRLGFSVSVHDVKWGRSCGSADSLEIQIKNDALIEQDIKICLKNSDGAFRCTLKSSVPIGQVESDYSCSFGGDAVVYARPAGSNERFPSAGEVASDATAIRRCYDRSN